MSKPLASSILAIAAGLALAAQTTAPSPAVVQQKASEYLKLAEDRLAQSTPKSAGQIRVDICVVHAMLGDIDAAKKSAATLTDSKLSTQLTIARLQANTDKPGALEYLRTLGSTWTSSPWDLTLIACAQADFGDLEGARQLGKGLGASANQAQVLSEIAYMQAQLGNQADAIKTLTEAKAVLKSSTNPAGFNLSHIALAQMQAGDVAGARTTADEVTNLRDRSNMLRAFATSAARTDKAVARDWLEQDRKLTLETKTAQLLETTLLGRQYATLGDTATAKELLDHARTLADELNTTTPAPTALSTVAAAQFATGETAAAADSIEAALLAVDRVGEARTRLFALWGIARQMAESGNFEGADRIIHLALKVEIDPGPSTRSSAETARALAHTRGEQAELAWISQLPTPDAQALVYAAAASGLLESSESK